MTERAGFTLIEIVIVILVLGIAMSPLLVMYGNIVTNSTDSQIVRLSSSLGRDLMEEILSKWYDEDPQTWTQKINLGIDAGEDPADKNTFDDVDDFVDWAPATYFDGFTNYTAQVEVIYVKSEDLDNAPEPDFGDSEYGDFKKITVTIRYGGDDRIDMVSVMQGDL